MDNIVAAFVLVAVLSVGFTLNPITKKNPSDIITIPTTDYEPREWVNYIKDEQMLWTATSYLIPDESSGVVFNWTWERLTLEDENGVRDVFHGMPIWNVFLADLNGDGFPELCATVSIGSGIVDTRVIVYDYINDKLYDLSDRMIYDYFVSMENGQLTVTQKDYFGGPPLSGGEVRATGSMAIIDGQLVTFGIALGRGGE